MVSALLAIANNIVDHCNKTIQSSHQIANRVTEVGPAQRSDYEIWKTVGWEKFLPYLDYQSTIQRYREAVENLSPETESIRALATAKFGKGECSEMSVVGGIEATKKGVHPVLITEENPVEPSYNHNFLVLVSTKESALQIVQLAKTPLNDVGEFFRQLQSIDCVIADPFLQFASTPSYLQHHGKDLFAYNERWEIENIVNAEYLDSSKTAQLESSAQAIYEEASKKVQKKNPPYPLLVDLTKEAQARLNFIFPGTSWQARQENGVTVFLECKEEKRKEVFDWLVKIGLTFTIQFPQHANSFRIVLQNPDLEKLRNATVESRIPITLLPE